MTARVHVHVEGDVVLLEEDLGGVAYAEDGGRAIEQATQNLLGHTGFEVLSAELVWVEHVDF